MEDLLSTGETADETLLQGILDEMKGVLENDVGAVVAYDGSRTRSDDAIKVSVGGARGQMAANGMQEKVQLEIWLSFLGIFGHIGIGTYDTSKPG